MMVDTFFKVTVYKPALDKAARCHCRRINSRE